MDPHNTPVDDRTIARMNAIAAFVRKNLTLDDPMDVADTVHAFLLLYAMNAKMIGMARKDAGQWFFDQWDAIQYDGEDVTLAQMPCSQVKH
jgi:hypothetical protein